MDQQTTTWIVIGVLICAAFSGGYLLKPEKTGPEKTGLTVMDDAGRTITISETPERVVVLHSGVVEIFTGIEEINKVVGAHKGGGKAWRFSTETWAAIENIPDVGSQVNPNIEMIMGLQPDLVITWARYLTYTKQLEDAGIPVIGFDPTKMDDIPRIIRTIGLIMDKSSEAENLVTNLQNRLDNIQNKLENIPENERVKVYFEVFTKTCGSGTLTNELIYLAGGVNIYGASPVRYPVPSYEYVIAENPDVIVLEASPSTPEDVKNRPGWDEINAVRNNRIHVISFYKANFNQHAVGAVEDMAKWFYPSLFPEE